MTHATYTPLQRVLTTLGHEEADRVPFFLLLTMHGAKPLGVPLREYLTDPDAMVEGQLRLQRRYGHDCLVGFTYAAAEVEAYGGEVIFFEDGPPNSGAPFLRSAGDIRKLEPVDVADSPSLTRSLRVIEGLHAAAGGEIPVFGVVMSPFSVPVMQMGFESYLRLMYEEPEVFDRLMKVNIEFCVAWANAQLAAGATAIVYFDPVSSPSIIPREKYLETGFRVACETLPRIKGATATHLASGRCLDIVDDLVRTGTLAVGVSALEDLDRVREACRGRLAVVGNLNGLAMCDWTPEEATRHVRDALGHAGGGGGYILSDNHGEIPFHVTDDVLEALAEAVRTHGRYPMKASPDG